MEFSFSNVNCVRIVRQKDKGGIEDNISISNLCFHKLVSLSTSILSIIHMTKESCI